MRYEANRDAGDENDALIAGITQRALGHPGLSKAINDAIFASEVEGGVRLKDLAEGRALRITTRNNTYLLRKQAGGKTYSIEGHPHYCPHPIIVTVNGSTFGGSMLKAGYVGRGMHLEVNLDARRTMTTSPITEIEEIK